jgi:hypothetical protein
MLEVIDGTGGGCEMKDAIDRPIDRNGPRHILPNERESVVALEMSHVLGVAGNEIVDADDLMTVRQKNISEMRSEKASGAGDQHPHMSLRPIERYVRPSERILAGS